MHTLGGPDDYAAAIEANKHIVRRFVADWLGARDASVLRELCHADIQFDWGILGDGCGIAALAAAEDAARAAFPDLTVTTRMLVAEGPFVVNVSDVAGTHLGAWLGVEPTGRRVAWAATEIYRVEGGKIRQQFLVEDWASVLFQIGGANHPVRICRENVPESQ